MNTITLNGYISGFEGTKKDDLIQVKFSICDQQSDNCKHWFKCYYYTKSDAVANYLADKKKRKEKFTIVGELRYLYSDTEQKENIIVKVNIIA